MKMLKAYLIAFLACVLFTQALLFTGCTIDAPINVNLPDPFAHGDMAHAVPADMAKPAADLAGVQCGTATCDPGQVCWHFICLDPDQVPDGG
jgi:hypothetical protein